MEGDCLIIVVNGIIQLRYPQIRTLVLPKIHSIEDLNEVSQNIQLYWKDKSEGVNAAASRSALGIVASIESARSLHNLGAIAGWQSKFGSTAGKLDALLVSLRILPPRSEMSTYYHL